MNTLKREILNLQDKLEKIELNIDQQFEVVEHRALKWEHLKDEVHNVIQLNKEKKFIKLNIGGKRFTTTADTLLSVENSFFARMLRAKHDNDSEIFIDRNPDYFQHILDYHRNKKINYKKFIKADLSHLREEAEFYNIEAIYNYINERMQDIEFVNFEFSGPFRHSDEQIHGTNNVEDLKDTNLTTGICTNTNGWIIIELNNEWDFEEIELGGFTGNSRAWYSGNGQNATIEVSSDRFKWNRVATIPLTFGTDGIIKMNFHRVSARYIKFQNNSYMGLGYLFINKIL
jgi:hypothetical protein